MVLFCPFFFFNQVSASSFHPAYEIFWESRSFCLTVLRQSFVAPVGLELAYKVAWPWTCPSLLSAVIKGMHCHSFPVLFEKIYFLLNFVCVCIGLSVCRYVHSRVGAQGGQRYWIPLGTDGCKMPSMGAEIWTLDFGRAVHSSLLNLFLKFFYSVFSLGTALLLTSD